MLDLIGDILRYRTILENDRWYIMLQDNIGEYPKGQQAWQLHLALSFEEPVVISNKLKLQVEWFICKKWLSTKWKYNWFVIDFLE